jgi:hypothetical protein
MYWRKFTVGFIGLEHILTGLNEYFDHLASQNESFY